MRIFGVDVFQSGGTYSSLPSVPRNEIVLFDKDTVVAGYSLLVDITDGVIYYTSGSGAGGDAGGALKGSGTWTQPNHSHSVTVDSALGHTHTMAHTHTTGDFTLTSAHIPAHQHNITLYTNQTHDEMFGGYYGTGPASATSYTHTTTSSGGSGGSHNHGATGAASSSTSSSDGSHGHTAASSAAASSNTWRPVGRCFTRQQRI